MAGQTKESGTFSGLEVVTPAHRPFDVYADEDRTFSTLESATSPIPPSFPKRHVHAEKQAFVVSSDQAEGLQNVHTFQQSLKEQSPATQKQSTRRKNIIIVSLVAVIVVAAAVIGGVCGVVLSKKSGNGGSRNGENNSAPGNNPSSTNSPSSSNSSASMTGAAAIFGYYDAPSVVTWGYPHMEVFITNDTQFPFWLSRYPNASDVNDWKTNRADATDGPFVFLTGQAAPFTHSISAIARGGNNTNVYAIGSVEHGLWSRDHNSTQVWNRPGWYPVDAAVTTRKVLYSAPGIGSWSEGRIDAFALGKAGDLWQYYYDATTGGVNGWNGFGGNFKTDFAPTIISWGVNRYDLFLVNQNGTMAYKYYDESWQPSQASDCFFDLGGHLTSRPFAITPKAGRIDVFARGGDAGLWHIVFDGSWGTWTRLGAANTMVKGDPSVVILGDNLHVFAWGDDNSLQYASFNWRTGSSENMQFETIAAGLNSAPTAVSDGVNVEVFAHVPTDLLGWKILSGGTQWSPSGQTMTGLWQF